MKSKIDQVAAEVCVVRLSIAREAIGELIKTLSVYEFPENDQEIKTLIAEGVFVVGESIELILANYSALRDAYRARIEAIGSGF